MRDCNMIPMTAIQQVREDGADLPQRTGSELYPLGKQQGSRLGRNEGNSDRSNVWVETSGTCRHTKTRRLVRGEEPNR